MADRCVCGGKSLSCDDVVMNQDGEAAVILACIICKTDIKEKIKIYIKEK